MSWLHCLDHRHADAGDAGRSRKGRSIYQPDLEASDMVLAAARLCASTRARENEVRQRMIERVHELTADGLSTRRAS
jgi:hypothetical protein